MTNSSTPSASNTDDKHEYDLIVLGGGAAGLMAAFTAGQRGRRVLLLETSNKLGKKILMSGGGRCNFTNLEVLPEHFICANPHFVKSALNQYTQWDFIGLVAKHGVAYHEKSHGQLFCDHSAKDILALLKDECQQGDVTITLNCETHALERTVIDQRHSYTLSTSQGYYCAPSVIVATGGLSIPSLGGASGFGYALAEQFGLAVNPTEASLAPFTLSGKLLDLSASLSGVSIPVVASVPSKAFSENLLFTHRGLSGPAILQLSNYWYLGEAITIDLYPSADIAELLKEAKQRKSQTTLVAALGNCFPKSLAASLVDFYWPELRDSSMQAIKDVRLQAIAKQLHHWTLTPSGTEGYRTAEVTRGGVSVDQISSKTMQAKQYPGLYFVGEVLDVTGHLGGFNFQWAWSSGYVAGINS